MGLRFRKSIKLGLVKVNLSKSGIGLSTGVRGARIGVNSRGTYSSVGIPGTGVYAMQYHSSGKSGSTASAVKPGTFAGIPSRSVQTKTGSGIVWVVLLDLILLAVQAVVGLIAIVLSLAWFFLYLKKQPSYQAKKRLSEAQAAYKAGDYQKAADSFEAAYAFFPSDKAIALLAASSYSQLKQYDKAAKLMEEYRAVHPEDVEMQKALARWYNELGEKDKALSMLQALDVEQAKDSGTLLLMADILSGKGLDTAAIEVLKRAPLTKRTLTPDLVEVIYALGLLYDKTGDTKHARTAFERVYAYDASFKDVTERVK
ncbi:MAG TPA: DUF4236 domain-containing protein [Candidatus Paceibacterota bacterium]|nr:DUF4236 domain-containing protein [Candidatus Paceibacterota bacterium]